MQKEFVGLYSVPQTNAGTISTVTTECVLPVEPMPLNKFRRQCYNGAGNISGQRTGVAIQDLESRALTTF